MAEYGHFEGPEQNINPLIIEYASVRARLKAMSLVFARGFGIEDATTLAVQMACSEYNLSASEHGPTVTKEVLKEIFGKSPEELKVEYDKEMAERLAAAVADWTKMKEEMGLTVDG